MKKRIHLKKALEALLLLCAAAVFLLAGTQPAQAASLIDSGALESSNVAWSLYSDGELVFTVPNQGAAQIPNMASDSAEEWLAYKSQVKTVTIQKNDESNITRIGDNAFTGCANLTSVSIPAGTVTALGNYVFRGCAKLTSLTLPSDLATVSSSAFNEASASLKLRVASPTSTAAKALTRAGYTFYKGNDNSFALQCSDSGVVTLAQYTGAASSVTVPSHVNHIAAGAFRNNTTITSVTIPANVTGMGAEVFSGCGNLTTVTLNEGLTAISYDAFENCSSLTTVNIPNSVTSIDGYAFFNCTSLTSLTLTDNVASVANTAFSGASNLRVYVPTPKGSAAQAVSTASNYYVVGDNAFALRYANTRYELRAYTGEAAAVTVPSHVDYIAAGAFMNNATVTSVTVPATVTGMGNEAFAGCENLTTVTLNEGLAAISYDAFENCTSLTTINIPNSVTLIDSYAFFNCTSLTSLTLTDNVASVANTAFSGASNLRVYVPTPKGSAAQAVSTASNYYVVGDNAFALRYANTRYELRAYTGTAASVTVPSHVDYIAAGAFRNNATVTGVTIPANVTGMGAEVFSGCENLTTVTLNEGLAAISYDAFENCTSLTTINIPNSVTLIDGYAFYNCTSLTSLTLTDNVASVANTAFSGASNLRVYVPTPKGSAAQAVSRASNYYVAGDNAFALRYENSRYELRAYTGAAASVTVPSHVDYIAAGAFRNNATVTGVTIPANVTGMGAEVFSGCENLTTVTLNEGLAAISYDAFENCTSLTTINIPNSVTLIDGYAFYNCTSLTSLTLTDNVASVANTAFSGASNLRVYVPTPKGSAAQAVSTASNYYVVGDNAFALRYANTRYELRAYTGTAASVRVPTHVDYIAAGAFMNYATLTSVTVPATVTGMGNEAFAGCENLTTVTLNEGLTAISYDAFGNCTSLTTINIPNSVTLIDGYAFYNCTSLTSLTLPDSIETIGNTAFSGMNDLRLSAGCGSYGADWAAGSGYTEVEADAPTGGKQLVLTHDWSVAYEWNENHTAVTGIRTCARDTERTHVETETVSATSAVTTPAACTVKGKTTYTSAAFTNPAFAVQTVTLTDVPALGHIWNEPTYAWNSAHTRVTATRTCQRADHPETETVTAASEITTPATCTAKGKTTYTSAAFTNAAFAVQTVTLTDVPALGHDWNAPTYAWNGDHTRVTATRTCTRADHPETETVSASGEVTTPAACTVMGKTTYTSAAFTNAAFSVQTVTLTDVPALGHDWNAPTYAWNDGHTEVTATRTCKRSASHRETETVTASSEITTPATCTTQGKTTYTSAAFSNAAFAVQTVTLTDIPSLGHDWNEPAYTWNSAHTRVTATHTCKRDASHRETETVTASSEITTPATCTVKGKTTYTSAAFANAAFSAQTVTLTDIPSLGHDWSVPTYAWNGDHTRVTATHTCKRDASHRETETVTASSEITAPATCTVKGKTTYTSAAFANAAFSAQTVTLADVPALGHDWNEPTYVWNDTHTQVTATHICRRDQRHREAETANAMAEVTAAATCTDMGQTTYTSAAFDNAAFSVQTATLTDVPALGHAWGAVSYVWLDNYTKLRAACVCARDESHTETETVNVTARITVQPTCTARGKTTYTASGFANEAFSAHSITLTNISPKGHSWGIADSTAAGSEDGVRGGVVCVSCGKVRTEGRTVSARKVLRLPAMMQTIEEEAFIGIAADQVVIPGGVDGIGSRAFAGCDRLLLAVIPASVQNIAEDAFAGCDIAVICPDDSPAAAWCDAHQIPHNP